MVASAFGAFALWLAVTQSPVWLVLVPGQVGVAGLMARQRLQVAARKGRRLRAAAHRA